MEQHAFAGQKNGALAKPSAPLGFCFYPVSGINHRIQDAHF
jgi:hypothetical protein